MSSPTPTPPTAQGAAKETAKAWIDKVSEELDRVPMSYWKQLAIYFVGAAFVGFVLKRYIMYALLAALAAAGLLWFLHYIGAAQFDFIQLKNYFGIAPGATASEYAGYFFSWAKTNVGLVIAAIVGFIIGLQLG